MCTSPNYLIWNGKVSHYRKDSKGKYIYHDIPSPKFNFCTAPVFEKLVKNDLKFIEVPCGKCLECRIQQSRAWADRCVLEAKKSIHNYFITLTYDDDNYPGSWIDDKTGCEYAPGSLNPRDMTLFIKRVRNCFPGVKIKVFYSGEYGLENLRPHFHIILFNCPLNDLTYRFKTIEDGKEKVHRLDNINYFFSETIWKCWEKKGNIVVSYFDYNTANYVASYCTKKVNIGYDQKFLDLGLYPEYIRMSRRPGLAADYFDISLYNRESIVIGSSNGAHVSSLPRYFDKLFIKKYGEDVFHFNVRNKRLEKKPLKVLTDLNLNHKKVIRNEAREVRLASKYSRNEKI